MLKRPAPHPLRRSLARPLGSVALANLDGRRGHPSCEPKLVRSGFLIAGLLAVYGFVLAPGAAAENPQVAGLQVALRSKGLYRGPIDGVQGQRTRAALHAFQRRVGLVSDGLAGVKTRAALGRLGRPLYGRRILRRGMVGWDVSVLQFLLARRGFPLGGSTVASDPGPRLRSFVFSTRLT